MFKREKLGSMLRYHLFRPDMKLMPLFCLHHIDDPLGPYHSQSKVSGFHKSGASKSCYSISHLSFLMEMIGAKCRELSFTLLYI